MQHLPTAPVPPQPPFKSPYDMSTEVTKEEGDNSHD